MIVTLIICTVSTRVKPGTVGCGITTLVLYEEVEAAWVLGLVYNNQVQMVHIGCVDCFEYQISGFAIVIPVNFQFRFGCHS